MKSLQLTSAQYLRLERALERQIAHLENAKQHLSRIDTEIYRAGRDLFISDAALIQWLSEPALSLGGRVPLTVMRNRAGRNRVANILKAIAHGVPL